METDPASPWHAGEIALQETAGSARRLAQHGHRIFRDHLNEQHRRFYPQLPFLVAGTVNNAGEAWATVLTGRPGFAHSPEPRTLSIAGPRDPNDPALLDLHDGSAIALLGIELHTRGRNRLNGTVQHTRSDGFDVTVEQAYGNCPQYIQLREFSFVRDPFTLPRHLPRKRERLDEQARDFISRADTFFVASYVDRGNGHREVDVSHRGGRPGFIRVSEEGDLTIPDFSGNQFFNTLGNIRENPRAGLVFMDFERGDLLQLSGHASVMLDSPQVKSFAGAERLWTFRPTEIVQRPDALPLRWTFEPDGWAPELMAQEH